MADTLDNHPQPPAELCGCPVDCALSFKNGSFLAIGPGGRGLVLKRLDTECLWKGQLHPLVRDRLNRVRELAHPGLANLFGVSREGDDAYVMWEYVEGTAFDEHIGASKCGQRELATLARELILTVDLLHMQGIVHGALVASNIIVTPAGGIRLTHISPHLFTDPTVDTGCVIALLEQLVESRGESASPLGQVLAEAHQQGMPLRQLGTKLAILSGPNSGEVIDADPRPVSKSRFGAWFGAAAATVIALAAAAGLWYAVQGGHFSASAAHVPPAAIDAGR